MFCLLVYQVLYSVYSQFRKVQSLCPFFVKSDGRPKIGILLGPNSQLANHVLTFHEPFPTLDACVFWLDMFCCVWTYLCVSFLTYLWFCFDQQSFSNLFFFPTYLQHRRVIDTGPIVDTTTILQMTATYQYLHTVFTASTISIVYSICSTYVQYLRISMEQYLQHCTVMDTGPIVVTITILSDSYVSVSTYSIYSIYNIYSIYVQYLQYLRSVSTYLRNSISSTAE